MWQAFEKEGEEEIQTRGKRGSTRNHSYLTRLLPRQSPPFPFERLLHRLPKPYTLTKGYRYHSKRQLLNLFMVAAKLTKLDFWSTQRSFLKI